MKFDLQVNRNVNLITGLDVGTVRIGSETIPAGLIVTPRELIRDWGPAAGAPLEESHLKPLLDLGPELILLGTGARQCFPGVAIMAAISSRGIGFEAMDSAAACRTYNVLVHEERRVVLALLRETPAL